MLRTAIARMRGRGRWDERPHNLLHFFSIKHLLLQETVGEGLKLPAMLEQRVMRALARAVGDFKPR